MAKSKINNIEYIAMIFTLALCINVSDSLFRFRYYTWIPFSICVIVIIAFLAKKRGRVSIKKIYLEMIKRFFLPLIIPSILSVFSSIIVYHNTRYIMSSFKYVLWVYGAYLFGYMLLNRYKIKAINMLMIAGTISYLTVIPKAIIYNDLGYLEVHELTYIYGLLLVFYSLYQGDDLSKKNKNRGIFICLIGVFLGNKRALWLALGISYGAYYLFYKVLKNRKKGLRFVAVISITVAFLWVWMIQSGLFELLCLRFGINDMSRLKMWNYFRNDYTFSLSYLGRGLTYTDVVMSEIHNQLHITTGIPIHNCILKMYIGWGTIPFMYYIYEFIYKRVINMEKTSEKNNAWLFLVVTLVFYIINFFGDTMFNMGISIFYAMVWNLLQRKEFVRNVYKNEKNRHLKYAENC